MITTLVVKKSIQMIIKNERCSILILNFFICIGLQQHTERIIKNENGE